MQICLEMRFGLKATVEARLMTDKPTYQNQLGSGGYRRLTSNDDERGRIRWSDGLRGDVACGRNSSPTRQQSASPCASRGISTGRVPVLRGAHRRR